MPTSFDAFVSYRRSDGRVAAERLRRAILSYRLPRSLRLKDQRKLTVFHDKSYERGAADFYTETISKGLKSSNWLIFIATPESVKSRPENDWVLRELEDFQAGPNPDNVIVARALGGFDDPLPDFFKQNMPNAQIVDIRAFNKSIFRRFVKRSFLTREILKIVGPLHGIAMADMPKLTLEEAKRTRKRITTASVALLAVIMGGNFLIQKAKEQVAIKEAHRLVAVGEERISSGHHVDGTALLLKAWPVMANLDKPSLPDLKAKTRKALFKIRELARWQTQDDVEQIALSPNGEKLIITEDGVRVYDSKTRQPLSPPSNRKSGGHIFFQGNAPIVGLQTATGYLLYDLVKQAALFEPIPSQSTVKKIARTRDGKLMALLNESEIILVSTATGSVVGQRIGNMQNAKDIRISDDGSRILVLRDKKVELVDALSGAVLAGPFDGGPIALGSTDETELTEVLNAEFIADGRLFIIAGRGAISVRESRTGMPVFKQEIMNLLRTYQTATTKQQRDAAAQTLSLIGETKRSIASGTLFYPDVLYRVVTASRGSIIAAELSDDRVQVYAIGDRATSSTTRRFNGGIHHLQFLGDHRRLLVVSQNKLTVLRVIDGMAEGASLQILEKFVHPLGGEVVATASNADGSLLLTTGNDNTTRLWQLDTLAQPNRWSVDLTRAKAVVFHPNEKWAAVASKAGTLNLYAPLTGMQVGKSMIHEGYVNTVLVVDGGKTLISESGKGVIRFWDPETQKEKHPPIQMPVRVRSMLASPDSKYFITATRRNQLQLWETSTRKPVNLPIDIKSRISKISFSPDSSLFFVLSDIGKTLELFSVQGQKLLGKLNPRRELLKRVRFSADSRSVLADKWSRFLVGWDIEAGAMRPIWDNGKLDVYSGSTTHDAKHFWTAKFDGEALHETIRVYKVGVNGPIELAVMPALKFGKFSEELFAVSDSGEYMAMMVKDGIMVQNLNLQTQMIIPLPKTELLHGRRDIVFTADESRVLVKTPKAMIAFDVKAGTEIAGSFIRFKDRRDHLEISPHGNYALLSGAGAPEVFAIPPTTGRGLVSQACRAIDIEAIIQTESGQPSITNRLPAICAQDQSTQTFR